MDEGIGEWEQWMGWERRGKGLCWDAIADEISNRSTLS